MTLLRYSGRGERGGRGRGGRGGRGGFRNAKRHAVSAKKSNRWVRPTTGNATNDDGDEEAEITSRINSEDVNHAQLIATTSNNNNEVQPLQQESVNSDGKSRLENAAVFDVSQKADPHKHNAPDAASLHPKFQETRFGSHAWKRTQANLSSKDRKDYATRLERPKPNISDDAKTMVKADGSGKSEGLYPPSENTEVFEAGEGVSVAAAAPEATSTIDKPHLQQDGLSLKSSQLKKNQAQYMYRVDDGKLPPSESGDMSSPADAVDTNDDTSKKSTKNDVASYVSSRKGTSLRRPTATVASSRGDTRSASSSIHQGAATKKYHQRSVETKTSSNPKLGAHKNKWVRSSAEAALASETKKSPPLDNDKEEAPVARLKYSKVAVASAAGQYHPSHSTSRHRGAHRRPPPPSTSASAPKRIKVSQTAKSSKELTSSDPDFETDQGSAKDIAQNQGHDMRMRQTESTSDLPQQQGKANDDAIVGEKLTDFAYRETSVRSGKKTKSRGLVRVQPQAAPICATFLRGVQCIDETCMKRHDVPQEYAMPICSFFQRQGMCLKENCRFRHVKVNPRAMPCPSFELLGFCDDPNCTMMHTRPTANKSNMVFDRKSAN